ncbi:DUF2237 family protein [bacterium]|nr:DUF2237 family protein [bacterium]
MPGNTRKRVTKNILGTRKLSCCKKPGKVTGFFRDGNCSTGPTDVGTHVVCAVMDNRFLRFTKSRGNDLTTPNPPSFPGLVAGDKWCVCALRWREAYENGKAPKILPKSTDSAALKYISKDILLSMQV